MKSTKVRLQRLGWSGVEIEYKGETLLIDYIQNTTQLAILRSPDEPFPLSSKPGSASAALVTHLHSDHADPSALFLALRTGAPVLRPAAASGTMADLALTAHAESEFQKHPLVTAVVGEWEEQNIGPFKISSAPAVDGFGDPQLSWIVECGGHRIIHAGDTLFHGFWWRIANKFGPFDIAFLPINAPVVDFPALRPMSPLEAVMSPEQAAVAAHLIGARSVVPIHYHSMNKPPIYIETPDPAERLQKQLENFSIDLQLHQPGTWFEPS
ncbi:MBL fold metallo-hydrolase [Pedobacter sp. MC2016-15]|uniref:MBL fold metallo-hydrolase n=1 Tax=Pedobacter sp. MC2016-15 TaxID=2994473 RepID=UPI00224726C3|nr:MBL fold metallo-hydrolase [Pedobacter sp. MC2016-15]MCX2478331.1 MBL fold metallo-hydrolase [Pedobacter sp. MC2016-15]